MIGLDEVIGLGAAGGGHHTPDAERTLVAELTAGHVVQLGTVGQEADVYALHVLLNIELRGSLSTGALQRGIELSQSVELHARALTHDLWDAAAQCSQHADDGVLGEGASVTCDVLCQSSGREGLSVHQLGIPLAVSPVVLILVLAQNNAQRLLIFCHSC